MEKEEFLDRMHLAASVPSHCDGDRRKVAKFNRDANAEAREMFERAITLYIRIGGGRSPPPSSIYERHTGVACAK